MAIGDLLSTFKMYYPAKILVYIYSVLVKKVGRTGSTENVLLTRRKRRVLTRSVLFREMTYLVGDEAR